MNKTLYTGGRWHSPINCTTTLSVVDPCTEREIQQIAMAGRADVDYAVIAARKAFEAGWSTSPGRERGALLHRIGVALHEMSEELAEMESRNVGKLISEAREDVADSVACFEYYAELANGFDSYQEFKLLQQSKILTTRLRREPLGVAALVVPWNYPLLLACWKVAPALAAGCTVVLKPSELTPLTAMALAKVTEEVGLPPGVFNLLTGDGPSCGRLLVAHSGVAKVSFTGSERTGAEIVRQTASALRPITLELGGKSPMIIFSDADLKQAVRWALVGGFSNAGQMCSATSRLLIEASIYDEFIDALVCATRKLQLGPGNDPCSQMGPLASALQLSRVEEIVQGNREDAVILTGGHRPTREGSGFFYEPTVVAPLTDDHALWTEEIFGPVLCVRKFETEAQAITIANDTRFGLAAAVMSRDLERCDRVARRLNVGVVWLNCSQPTPINAPWGGRKQSGVGTELGVWGLDSYLTLKQITTVVQ
jgi:betaine-aldehyde dehydrogenase